MRVKMTRAAIKSQRYRIWKEAKREKDRLMASSFMAPPIKTGAFSADVTK
jgi:hypothetical protein